MAQTATLGGEFARLLAAKDFGRDGRITWMRVLCSGFREIEAG